MPDMEYRFSDQEFEYRADDNGLGTVSGVIVRYGDVAQLSPHVTEQIERGAFDLSTPWWVNRMHQRQAIPRGHWRQTRTGRQLRRIEVRPEAA